MESNIWMRKGCLKPFSWMLEALLTATPVLIVITAGFDKVTDDLILKISNL